MADTEDKVVKAKKLIHNVIETAASIPEGQNELKRNQLRELAALNGTLRDDENQACQNCGEIGHRKYDCPHQRNFTANIICRVCGNAGHMARDCPDRQRGTDWRNNDRGQPRAQGRIGNGEPVDQELESFMQTLGGTGRPARIEAGPGGDDGDRNARPPWQQGPSGGAAPWRQSNGGRDGGAGGAAPPWAGGGGRNDNYGQGYNQGGGAPWQQGGGGGGYGYQDQGGYGGGYGGQYGGQGYNQGGYGQQGGAAPPWQQSNGYGAPPPPPSGDAPPPPPSDNAPPPPPPA